jgi:hypothetical protein
MRNPDDDTALIAEVRQRLKPHFRWLAGDMSPAEYDLHQALRELEEFRKDTGRTFSQAEEWACDVIVKLANKGAKEWSRGRGKRTTYKHRNTILEAEVERLTLMERRISLIGACRIISKALAHIPGAMTADAIKTAVRPKSGN